MQTRSNKCQTYPGIEVRPRPTLVNLLAILVVLVFGSPAIAQTHRELSTHAPASQQLNLSLKRVSEIHADVARTRLSNPQLFQVRLPDISGEEFSHGRITMTEIESSFASQDDDVWHLRIIEKTGQQYASSAKHNFELEKDAFVLKRCDQGYVLPEMKCGLPTGESEPKQQHLAVCNWTIDLMDIPAILRRENYQFLRHMSVTVTTVARIKASSEMQDLQLNASKDNLLATGLAGLREDQAVVAVVGWSDNSVSNQVRVSIIHGGTGQILQSWNSVLEPILLKP